MAIPTRFSRMGRPLRPRCAHPWSSGLALAAIACLAVDAHAQEAAPAARIVRVSLQTAGPQEPAPSAAVRARGAAAALTRTPVATVAEARSTAATRARRQRRPDNVLDYAEDTLVIVGLSSARAERTRQVIADPRLVRIEPWYAGDSQVTRLYLQSVEFSITVNDPEVTTLEILRPTWDGEEWRFEALAEAAIR